MPLPHEAMSNPTEHDNVPAGERRVAERRAPGRRSSQAVLRQIVDRLADGVVVVGSDGRIRLDFFNPRPDEVAVLLTAHRRGTR